MGFFYIYIKFDIRNLNILNICAIDVSFYFGFLFLSMIYNIKLKNLICDFIYYANKIELLHSEI